jgi:hypothetical protein
MFDFYLTSSDSAELNAHPRACTVLKEVREIVGEALEVEVKPALPGAVYGSQEDEVSVVILAPRLEGDSILNTKTWPVEVYVVERAPRNAEREDYHILAWGELWPTEDEARRAYYPPLHKPQSAWPKPGDYSESDDPWREMR